MDRRTLLKTGLATTAGGLLIPAVGGLTNEATARPRVNRVLARDLRTPWGIAFLPGGNALVGERDSGRIYKVRKSGGRHLIGRVPNVAGGGSIGGEGGLLGLALSPHFRRDHWLYAYMSTRNDNRVVRMRHNYGWPRVEGKDGPGGYHDPFVQFPTEACSPSGVAIANGRAWLGALAGTSLYTVRLS